MKKEQRSVGYTQSLMQWISEWFYTPEVNEDEMISIPPQKIATTHMRLLGNEAFKPNQTELLNDLIRQLQTIKVSPKAMLFMGMAMLAQAQHMHPASLTFADANGGHYRYSFDPSYSQLTQSAEQFNAGAAGVIPMALNFTNSTTFYEGFRVWSSQMIAMLAYHTGSNATLAEMDKIKAVVAPAIQNINDAIMTTRRLEIGLPLAVVGFALLLLGTTFLVRKCCKSRKAEYVDLDAKPDAGFDERYSAEL